MSGPLALSLTAAACLEAWPSIRPVRGADVCPYALQELERHGLIALSECMAERGYWNLTRRGRTERDGRARVRAGLSFELPSAIPPASDGAKEAQHA